MRRPALALLLLLATPSEPLIAAQADDRAAAAELRTITDELNELETWFGASDRELVSLQRELETNDRQIASAREAIDAALAQVVAAETSLETLRTNARDLRTRQGEQARRIADHLSAAERLEGQDLVKLLLNQESPEDFERMVRYHQYFSAARIASLERYRQTLVEVKTNESRLEDTLAKAAQLRDLATARQTELEHSREARRQLVAQIEQEQRDKDARRKTLEGDKARLESLLARLKRSALGIDGKSFAQSRGKLPWPLEGRVLHGFGAPRAEGRMHWDGILIATDEGAPFHAVQRGRVVFADWLRGYGLMTIVDHGGGYLTLYGQADSLARKVGDRIEAGELLGKAGRSGGSRDAGLYFELRHNGQARDPSGWLRKR